MKTFPILSLAALALLFAGCSDKSDKTAASTETTLSQKADAAASQVKAAAVQVADDVKTAAAKTQDAIADKMVAWKLTPADIKADLATSGRVIRDKTVAVGEKSGELITDARIVTVINGKLLADSDLSALKINVDASNHVVTLTGTVKSPALIGRALELALDTDGVTQAVSLLKVE